MSGQGKFWQDIDKRSKRNNPSPVSVGQIKALDPLEVQYNGITISVANGDSIYVNHLLLDEQITFTQAQPITCSDGVITENHTDIINDEIETWLKSVHGRFIIKVGDLVAVQKLGNNTYLILEKVQKIE